MMNIIIFSNSVLFHCNCFVCSMLELIDSRSILIDSCWHLSHIHQKAYFLIGRKCVIEEWKALQNDRSWIFSSLLKVHQGDPAIFPFSIICSIKTSLCFIKGLQNLLLVVYLVSHVYVRRAKSLGCGGSSCGRNGEKQHAPPGGTDFVRKRWPVGVCVNSVLL